jgi:hypothetical protein
MTDKKQRQRRARRLATNVLAAGAGTGLGYMAGGALAKALSTSPRFLAQYRAMSPAKRKLVKNSLKYTGSAAGLVAGAAASHRLTANEKTASLCISFYKGYV